MERDKRRMMNNVQNDIFRLLVRLVKVLGYMLFGGLLFYALYTPLPKEVVCKTEVIVEFTGGSTFIIPSALPRTGAEGTK